MELEGPTGARPAGRLAGDAPDQLDWRVIAPIALTAFVGLLNNFALGPFLPDMSEDLGVSVPVLGQVATATFLMTALGGVVVGPLADHIGHRRTILAGLLMTLVSAIGTALAPNFEILLAARLLGGVGGSISSGVTLAVAGSQFSGDARRRALSLITATVASAVIVGAPMLTSVGALLSWRGAFWVVAGATAISLVLLIYGMPGGSRASGFKLSARAMFAAYQPIIEERGMVLLFLASMFQAISWVGPFTYLGAFLDETHGFTTQEVGFGFMMVGGGFFIGSVIGGGRLGGLDLRAIYAVTTALMGLMWGVVMIAPVGPYQTIALLGALTTIGGIGRVSFTTLLADETPAGPATTMVLNSSVLTLGAALGSLLGGLLIGGGGYSALGLGLPVFAFLASILVWKPRSPASETSGEGHIA